MIDALFQGDALWFTIPAILGTVFFLLRVALMLIGHHADVDVGHDMSHAAHADSGEQFEILSVQSALAMAMGFGWGGLGVLKGSGLPLGTSLIIGLAAGAGMVFLLAWLMTSVRRLSASGNMPLSSLDGAVGEVTLTVPARGEGKGEVRVVVDTRERRCAAVSDGAAMPTRTRVSVSGINSDNTVTVRPV